MSNYKSNSATTYYDLVDSIKHLLETDPSINTVSYGELDKVANDKSTLYPLGHFIVDTAKVTERTFIFKIRVTCLDIIDQTNDSITDKVRGNDNTMDIHNTMLAVLSRLVLALKRKSARDDGYVLVGEPDLQSFTHRFLHDTAGWYTDISVEVIQSMGVCNISLQ